MERTMDELVDIFIVTSEIIERLINMQMTRCSRVVQTRFNAAAGEAIEAMEMLSPTTS